MAPKTDQKRDLVLERVVDVPPNLVWAAWTRPDYIKQWFTPVPWQTVDCEVDLRPGGYSARSCGPPKDRNSRTTAAILR